MKKFFAFLPEKIFLFVLLFNKNFFAFFSEKNFLHYTIPKKFLQHTAF